MGFQRSNICHLIQLCLITLTVCGLMLENKHPHRLLTTFIHATIGFVTSWILENNKQGQLLTGETPFHRLKKFSVLMTLMKTVNIPTLGALQDEMKESLQTHLKVQTFKSYRHYSLRHCLCVSAYYHLLHCLAVCCCFVLLASRWNGVCCCCCCVIALMFWPFLLLCMACALSCEFLFGCCCHGVLSSSFCKSDHFMGLKHLAKGLQLKISQLCITSTLTEMLNVCYPYK